jgi:hypothetical protein
MKAMLMLRAVALVFSLGIGTAYASDRDGQSAPPPFSSSQFKAHSVFDGAPRSRPLFNIGGFEVHVRAPETPPYNAEASGDLAARNIWGAG